MRRAYQVSVESGAESDILEELNKLVMSLEAIEQKRIEEQKRLEEEALVCLPLLLMLLGIVWTYSWLF